MNCVYIITAFKQKTVLGYLISTGLFWREQKTPETKSIRFIKLYALLATFTAYPYSLGTFEDFFVFSQTTVAISWDQRVDNERCCRYRSGNHNVPKMVTVVVHFFYLFFYKKLSNGRNKWIFVWVKKMNR